MTGHQDALMRLTLVTFAVKLLVTAAAAVLYGLVGVAAATCAIMVVQGTAACVMARRLVGVRTWARWNPLPAVRGLLT